MKRNLITTNRKHLQRICFYATLPLILGGCTTPDSTSTENSNYYTRGIGMYPGSPSEDFSPSIISAPNTYRNLALLRQAKSSSSYDYNLTAQLITDGIVSDSMPHYINLSTPKGDVPRREREWLFDQGPYSRNIVEGENAYFTVSLNQWKEQATKVQFRGMVAYHEEMRPKGYEFICEGSNDGKSWQVLGNIKGNGLPGKPSKYKSHSDPNKNSGDEAKLPTRLLNETLTFKHSEKYAFYRVNFKMNGAAYWTFFELNFFNQDQLLNFLPSKFFNSTWMSSTAGEEWVMIDLGKEANIQQIVLKWINKAIKGDIQVSSDSKTWTNLAELPQTTDTTDRLNVNGKGRYVRILMHESINNKPYVLSEVEVMGQGGVTVAPAPTPTSDEENIYLSGGNWKLQRASEVSSTGENISKSDFDDSEWIIATVPGTVLTSYKNIGAIPNPNYADNLMHISESFFNSDFWYRDEFNVPSDFQKERTFLNFDGINWKANIFLNGKRIGRMEGAFIRGKFDVTDFVRPGKNVLAVQIIKNAHIGAIKEKYEKNTDFNGGILGADNPTFHASIGWDWISTIRGRNIGIWNDVYLSTKGNVTLHDPFVLTEMPLPDTTSVAFTPEIIVKNHDNHPVEGVLNGKIGDISFNKVVGLKANEEKTVRFTPAEFKQLNLKDPQLWWPKGSGSPHLYDANFTFKINDNLSDSTNFKVGVRQMTYQEKDGILTLYVNGRRFIARGGNWGFGESNLNYRGREYDAAVKYHTDMNFTMMRNWVGQIGDEELYEACDRHGLMIWQDFWLANPADGPDPYYEDMFMDNATDYVKRIRNHPSIGIYCGRNEGFPPASIDKAIRQLLKKEHPDLHYISSSADDVVSGHGPYRALAPKEYFRLENGKNKLHSERGMPNVMNYESLVRTFSPDALWPQNAQWGQHDYTQEGAQSCATFNAMIAKGFGEPTDAKEFADLAQWINYNGYRALFESRSENRKGLLLWMTHPCWPSMVWQTYDYYFEPTAAYFGCKKACEPIHIQWNQDNDMVEVVNYSAGKCENLRAEARILNLDGSIVWKKELNLSSQEDTTIKCFPLDFDQKLSATHFIKLILSDKKNQIISDNFYLRGLEEGNFQELKKLSSTNVKVKQEVSQDTEGNWFAKISIENQTNIPALMLRVNLLGEKDGLQILPVIYSDNYFSLLPGEKKEVKVQWKDVDTRGNKPQLVITGYNVK